MKKPIIENDLDSNAHDTSFSRLSFLKISGIAGGGMIAATSVPKLNAFEFNDSSRTNPQQPRGQWLPTTCQGCTSWCSKQIYVVDGRAIKVRGNPNSKVNGKASCVKAHLGLQQVYDPDRVKTPMKRTNPKKAQGEDPQFVPITWDEALDTVADKIMELRDNEETHKYMLMRGRYSYMRDIIYDRMTKIIGSPNNISHSSLCAEAEKFGPYYTEGGALTHFQPIVKFHIIQVFGANRLKHRPPLSLILDTQQQQPNRISGCR